MQEILNDSTFALDNLYAHFKLDVSTGLPNDPVHVFAKSPHAVDSINVATAPDVFMHNLENAFEQQHDGHTQIIYPKPYSCYAAGILPNTLSLKYAYDANNTPYVSVSLAKSHPYTDLSMGTQYDNVINQLAGTVITQINGVNISDILAQTGGASSQADFNHFADIGNGANSDAQISEGLNFLFFRLGELTPGLLHENFTLSK